jgi:site-specific recombinase XerD
VACSGLNSSPVYSTIEWDSRFRYTDTVKQIYTPIFTEAIAAYQSCCEKNGLSPKSVRSYQGYAERFLEYAEQRGAIHWSDITGDLVQSFFLTLSNYYKVTIKNALYGTRRFFKFLYVNEYTSRDLSGLVVSLKIRAQTKIPSIWNKDEVLQLLSAVDRGNSSGKRDYAILLLVTRMGLRIGDVVKLQFEELNWSQQSIEFIQSKTNRRTHLPLLKDVGWALIDYIQNGRPKIDSNYVFVTHIPPFTNFSPDNCHRYLIAKLMKIAGIQNQSHQKRGMHSLRYTLANRMLANKEPTRSISAALGHANPDSVSIYLKTDIEALRECALSLSEVGIW